MASEISNSEKEKIEIKIQEDNNSNAEYIHDVSEYDKSYSIPIAILKLVGLRLGRKDSNIVRYLWNVFYWFQFGNLFICTILEVVYMVETASGRSFQDGIEIFRMMPCVGYLWMAMTKSYKMVIHRSVYENLVDELRSMWPQGRVSKEEHDIITTAMKQLKVSVVGYYWCNNALLVIFLTPPFVELLKRALGHDVPLIFPFFYWFPFNPFEKYYYEVILAFQTWHGLITIWFMLCGDLLFCIFLNHITMQFDLLCVRIRRLLYVPVDHQLLEGYPLAKNNHEQANNLNNNEEFDRVHKKELSEIILRHRALIRLAGDVEDMFSFALLVNFSNASIIICFCGFCCVMVEHWNEMIYKSFLSTAVTQIWLLCWYGQRLLEASEGVSNAIYNCGWYMSTRKIKSTLFIIMCRSQKQVRVTTYGFSVISLTSYTTIIKSAWSYFTLLLNVYKQK